MKTLHFIRRFIAKVFITAGLGVIKIGTSLLKEEDFRD